jgi:hypothetical protein
LWGCELFPRRGTQQEATVAVSHLWVVSGSSHVSVYEFVLSDPQGMATHRSAFVDIPGRLSRSRRAREPGVRGRSPKKKIEIDEAAAIVSQVDRLHSNCFGVELGASYRIARARGGGGSHAPHASRHSQRLEPGDAQNASAPPASAPRDSTTSGTARTGGGPAGGSGASANAHRAASKAAAASEVASERGPMHEHARGEDASVKRNGGKNRRPRGP